MRFEARDGAFYADGKKTVIYSGAMHYFRVLPEYWHDRLSKLKACGFNTVETYMCWNLHEPKKGQFDFSGRLDIRRYIETARKLGLYVILRPGPYICAEWDAGGFPAWLLADENLRLRCNDAVYLSHVRDYIARVMEEVGDLQCTEGGPIIAMQVENEYGSYGNDKTYLAALKGIMEECGAKVLLFTSDGTCPYMLAGGSTPGALVTVNFGSNVAGSFAALKEVQKDAPEMCTEFWCGWFDHFGEKHHTRGYKSVLKEVEAFLDRGASFNFYMFHGGTNFGFTAGANYAKRYQPTVTSYDYCALLNEYGGYTPAYHAVRDLMWSKQGVKPPVLPHEPETQDIGKVSLTECTGLMENEDTVGVKHRSALPLSMEKYGQNFGLILYRTVLPGDYGTGFVSVRDVRDLAHVYVNGERRRTFRRIDEGGLIFKLTGKHAFLAQGMKKGDEIAVLVDAMGRVNYGEKLCDRKGISAVMFNNQTLMDFDVTSFPLDNLEKLDWSRGAAKFPKFFRGTFTARRKAECFVRFDGFTKGYIWVNGFNLGRFWNVGPQRALYLPGALLHTDRPNEIVVLELARVGDNAVGGAGAGGAGACVSIVSTPSL